MTLKTYARQFGLMPVADVDAAAVLNVLQPIWRTKGETACRLRGRPETVLDAAKAHGLRIGEKPARWRGHLDKLLPKRSKLTRDHYAAMPYADVPEFISQQREREAIAALALEFLILTAARSGEVLCARWEEIDFAAKVWTVPAKRMKSGREHRVPAIEILKRIYETRASDSSSSARASASRCPRLPLEWFCAG